MILHRSVSPVQDVAKHIGRAIDEVESCLERLRNMLANASIESQEPRVLRGDLAPLVGRQCAAFETARSALSYALDDVRKWACEQTLRLMLQPTKPASSDLVFPAAVDSYLGEPSVGVTQVVRGASVSSAAASALEVVRRCGESDRADSDPRA